jgi:hypothetical protein
MKHLFNVGGIFKLKDYEYGETHIKILFVCPTAIDNIIYYTVLHRTEYIIEPTIPNAVVMTYQVISENCLQNKYKECSEVELLKDYFEVW